MVATFTRLQRNAHRYRVCASWLVACTAASIGAGLALLCTGGPKLEPVCRRFWPCFFNCFLNLGVCSDMQRINAAGISTTAAHDCLYEQSFPVLLNETMGRLMSAAGVRFEAINVAMGNTRVAPYSYCVDAHAGLNADIISWDMSMVATSYACGRAAAGVELFIRTASSLPRRPAVLLTDAFPDQVSLVFTWAYLSWLPPPLVLCVCRSVVCSVLKPSIRISSTAKHARCTDARRRWAAYHPSPVPRAAGVQYNTALN